MNNKFKTLIVAGVVLVVVLSMVAMFIINGGGNNYDYGYDYDMPAGEYEENADIDDGYAYSDEKVNEQKLSRSTGSASKMVVADGSEPVAPQPYEKNAVYAGELDRMIKKDATMRIKGEHPYEIYSNARQKAIAIGGAVMDYNESISNYDGKEYQIITCTLSVPSSHFRTVVSGIRELGEVIGLDENAEDMTSEYYNLESDLGNRTRAVQELNRFYTKAKNVEESLDIYSRIQQIQREIDQIEGQMKYVRAMTSQSRIHLTISQPDADSEPTPSQSRFMRGLSRLWDDIVDGVVWLIGFLILMVFISIMVFILVLLGSFIFKKLKVAFGNKTVE